MFHALATPCKALATSIQATSAQLQWKRINVRQQARARQHVCDTKANPPESCGWGATAPAPAHTSCGARRTSEEQTWIPKQCHRVHPCKWNAFYCAGKERSTNRKLSFVSMCETTCGYQGLVAKTVPEAHISVSVHCAQSKTCAQHCNKCFCAFHKLQIRRCRSVWWGRREDRWIGACTALCW